VGVLDVRLADLQGLLQQVQALLLHPQDLGLTVRPLLQAGRQAPEQ
jgi:hypothetical protein